MYTGKKYSLATFKALMRKIAKKNDIPEQVENTWLHSKVVYKFADKISKLAAKNGHYIDHNYIKAACFAHDMGRMVTGSKGSKILEQAIYHGFHGYKILKKYKYPEKFARICFTHIAGSGVDKITNRKFNIFKNRETLAKTVEEKIIAYSDARTDYDKKKKKPFTNSFLFAFKRFNKYPRVGKRLKKNHQFILNITGNKIR